MTLAAANTGTSSGFVTIMVALIAAVVSLGTVWISLKVKQVHTLVNSRLGRALDVIAVLTNQLVRLGVEPAAKDEG